MAFRESESLPRGQKRKSCSEALASGEVAKARVTSVTRDWREDVLTKRGETPLRINALGLESATAGLRASELRAD